MKNAANFAQISARMTHRQPLDNELAAELKANRKRLTASCSGFGCGSATLELWTFGPLDERALRQDDIGVKQVGGSVDIREILLVVFAEAHQGVC